MTVGSDLVARIAAGSALTAGAFIVTVFGDVVEPRGGRLATASILEACERVGLNPTQVRTALSRLVAGRRLESEREGRRSQHRLTLAGRAEFLTASQAIFAPERPRGWAILWAPAGEAPPSAAARRIGPDFWIAPAGVDAAGALVLAAQETSSPLSAAMARGYWALGECEASYAAFETLFHPLTLAANVSGENALMLRLLLTHGFRAAALRDPLLPRSALPVGWRGDSARRLFSELYLALSPAAEMAIAAMFSDGESLAFGENGATEARAAGLRLWLARGD